jgi:hypothetical protein
MRKMTFEGLLGRLFSEPQPRKKRTGTRSKPEDKNSSKVSDILEIYATRDEIQDILYGLGLPVSGSKEDLILRVVKETKSMPTDEVLDLITRDTLRSICEDYGLRPGGLKSEIIDKIIAEVLDKSEIIGRPVIQKGVAQEIEAKPVVEPSADPLDEILDRMSREQVQSALRKMDLPVSGNKTQVVERLLEATKRDPRRTLEALPGDGLQYFADRKKITRRRSKEDQVEEILVTLFGQPRRVREVPQKMTPIKPEAEEKEIGIRRRSPQVPRMMDRGFDALVREIEEWTPSRIFSHEEGYQASLEAFLRERGHITRMERGESRADIVVDEKYPIALKKGSRLADYDSLHSQVLRHHEEFGYVIAVVFSVRALDQFEIFKERVAFYLKGPTCTVIRKP